MSQESPEYTSIPREDALAFVQRILEAHGVSSTDAATVADNLVSADLRGVDSHGINRIPSYVARVRQGVLDPKAQPTITQPTPVVAQIDGHNAFGAVVAKKAMSAAVEMAQVYGIGMVSCKHSNHFGMSAWVVQQAIDAGMLSLVFTNSSPALPAWGGREMLLGVSPIACGAPGEPVPFILDMAPSVAARGKIYKAKRRGEKIPDDWALDAEGKPTDDPAKALDGGVMLPVGGPKGSALAIMMDVFSGVLSGSAFAGHVAGPYDPSRHADVGHFIIAMKPDLFVSAVEFKARMKYLYERVVGAEKMVGVDRIYFPGEIEINRNEERLKTGIPYAKAEIEALNKEAESIGVKPIV
ncbi:Malate/L-lactate dehydrogenase [Pseudomassariella vexata]|uniref:Malate/L-lactate dehydrogenase n=1 Tax=Pseudomassariella vexata TaxID=1141098 RepID=A0A1Y2DSG9_9PEZI|nr:Malate/L-lactate dehydrogenase [Pseudomassariella vexata]ORY61615.1 Malate/L-lactate dehydrogenase [Pseudomassariella vexata]